jgi:hypothetical protein
VQNETCTIEKVGIADIIISLSEYFKKLIVFKYFIPAVIHMIIFCTEWPLS